MQRYPILPPRRKNLASECISNVLVCGKHGLRDPYISHTIMVLSQSVTIIQLRTQCEFVFFLDEQVLEKSFVLRWVWILFITLSIIQNSYGERRWCKRKTLLDEHGALKRCRGYECWSTGNSERTSAPLVWHNYRKLLLCSDFVKWFPCCFCFLST